MVQQVCSALQDRDCVVFVAALLLRWLLWIVQHVCSMSMIMAMIEISTQIDPCMHHVRHWQSRCLSVLRTIRLPWLAGLVMHNSLPPATEVTVATMCWQHSLAEGSTCPVLVQSCQLVGI